MRVRFSLRPPNLCLIKQNSMKINEINNLLELFFLQYKKQNKDNLFLNSLKDPNKKYSWKNTYINIINLSKEISKYINKGDRCLIISENRPEWMITDLSIMLASGITVPAYTTYVERDYEYIIDDCAPTIVFVGLNLGLSRRSSCGKNNIEMNFALFY